MELHTHALGMAEDYGNLDKSTENGENLSGDYTVITDEDIMQKYNGQYDNLLYFFKYMYDKIHSIYNPNKLMAYNRPLI